MHDHSVAAIMISIALYAVCAYLHACMHALHMYIIILCVWCCDHTVRMKVCTAH